MAASVAERSIVPEPAVLVVDDDRDIREALAELLEDAGYRSAIAENGAQALAWLRAHPGETGVVLLDLMMPVMDGLTFLDHRAQDDQLAAIPVVVFTANAVKVSEVLASGRVVECLQKPLSWDRLVTILRDQLGLTPSRPTGAPRP
jgi:CheY-like chemotaxis protein